MHEWPSGSYFCLTCQGNHTGACFESLAPLRSGFADTSDDGSSGYAFAVYDRAAVEAECARGGESVDELSAFELTGWSRFSSGPGRAFGAEASIKVYKRRILVTQFRGLDI